MAMHYQTSIKRMLLITLAIACNPLTSFPVTLNFFSCFDTAPLMILFTALYATPHSNTTEAAEHRTSLDVSLYNETTELNNSSPSLATEELLEAKKQKCINASFLVKHKLEKLRNDHLYPLKDVLGAYDYSRACDQFNLIFKNAVCYSSDPHLNFAIAMNQETDQKILYHKKFITEHDSYLETNYTEEELINFRKKIFKQSIDTNVKNFQAIIMRPVYKQIKRQYQKEYINKISPIYRHNAEKVFNTIFYPLKKHCDMTLHIQYNSDEHRNVIFYKENGITVSSVSALKDINVFLNSFMDNLQQESYAINRINDQRPLKVKAALKKHLEPLYSS